MAFNQGPQPSIQDLGNGIRYIDPNPTDEIVNHEDLVMYVKLIARTKGRSILTVDGDEATTVVEQTNKITNFTYPTGDSYLDTRWTNIGGGSIGIGEDVGAFGITNINIEFKSSFMPQIVIDFVDVRGATLFEQGPCSPYAAFFHLPYPVFELTVKGYYGKPVTYTLALVKFNTKFNADTGNFESRGEFVGYTYAFLADIPMGYVLASTYIKYPLNGKEVLKSKWAKLIERPGLSDGENPLPAAENALTLFDLIRNAKKLETELPRLKNDSQVQELTKITKAKSELTSLRDTIEQYKRDYLTKIGNNTAAGIRDTNGNKNTMFLKVSNTSDINDAQTLLGKATELNTSYFGDGKAETFKTSLVGSKYTFVQSVFSANGTQGCPDLNVDKMIKNSSGFFGTTVKDTTANPADYYIDLYEAFLKDINTSLKEIESQYTKQRDAVKENLNIQVAEILGFFPNIRNVFAIILTNVEVFLELLLQTSILAEEYHDSESIETGLSDTQQILDLKDKINGGAELSDENKEKLKVYPWPTYYEKLSVDSGKGDPGSKEKYPGDNIQFTTWPEVLFVEDFIRALTELAKDLAILDMQVEDVPGFDNFAPITTFETHALGEPKAPNRWYSSASSEKLSPQDNLLRTMGENAFLLGDYTMINTLTLWKSQLGFKNGWGFQTFSNGATSFNGYVATNNTLGINAGTQRPYRFSESPAVDITKTNLDRYEGSGMRFIGGVDEDSFETKIIPTTKTRIKQWGYIDALNAMSTLGGEGNGILLQYLKNLCEPGKNDSNGTITTIRDLIKKHLETVYGNDGLLVQSFDTWKGSATAEIGGTVELIDKQIQIWQDHFSYVTSNNVWSLKGPISLNDNTELTETLIYADPNKNPSSGARLIKADDDAITARNIDFKKEILGDKIWNQYKQYYAYGLSDTPQQDTTTNNVSTEQPEDQWGDQDNQTQVDTGEGNAKKQTLSYTLLNYRPKYTEAGKTAYQNISKNGEKTMVVDKNTALLSLGTEFYPNFYHSFLNGPTELTGDDKMTWDLDSSRSIRGRSSNVSNGFEWADFIGLWFGSTSGKNNGSADSITSSPLWTLNYPLYKNPWYYAGGNIANVEFEANNPVYTLNFYESGAPQRRNWGTWWGLNQWGINNSNDIYKPLAYIAVMSFGLDFPNDKYKIGHFPPHDGSSFNDLSSFCNFTYVAMEASLPKSYVLLIGAMLWRMKESNLLDWDEIPRTSGKPTSHGGTPGWNSFNKSVGIDDLGDPVWFFHNSLSRPWNFGGCVFNDPSNAINFEYADTNDYYYGRRWIGRDLNDIDRWTGDIRYGNNDPISIGTVSTGNFNYTPGVSFTKGYGAGWTKSHTKNNSGDNPTAGTGRFRNKTNINKGLFDQCRPDQMPFVWGTKWQYPKTLVITDYSKTGKDATENGTTKTAPNRGYSNSYPRLKESVKELMFIPRTLKLEFIEAFEEWATTDLFSEGGWLSTLDPLNFAPLEGIKDFKTSSDGNYDTTYITNGWFGFVGGTHRDNNNYGDYQDEDNNLWKNTHGVWNFNNEDYFEDDLTTNSDSGNSNYAGSSSSEPQAFGCFTSGHKIKLINGDVKNIEDILPNEKVISYNLNTKTFEESIVDEVKIHYTEDIITLILDNGIKLNSTTSHPFYVEGKGWSSYSQNNLEGLMNNIQKIVIGDKIYYYENNNFNLVGIKNIIVNKKRMRQVYTLKNVSGNNNFIVNNVLVHNKQ